LICGRSLISFFGERGGAYDFVIGQTKNKEEGALKIQVLHFK